MSQIATRATGGLQANPFDCLPIEYRIQAVRINALFLSRLPDPREYLARLSAWIGQRDTPDCLTPEDLEAVGDIVSKPAWMAAKSFGEAGFQERFAEVVGRVIQQRLSAQRLARSREEARQRLAEGERLREYRASPAGQAERESIKQMILKFTSTV
jgi:hypothetical protein